MAQEGGLHRGAGARTYSDIDDYYNIGAAKGLRLTSWDGADVKGIIEYDASGDLIFSTVDQSAIMTIKNDGSGVVFGGTSPGFLVDFVRASSAADGLELRNFGESAVLTLGVANTLDAAFAGALGVAGDVTLAADKKIALEASGTGATTLGTLSSPTGVIGAFVTGGAGGYWKIGQSGGVFGVLDSAGTSVLLNVKEDGIITGTSTIPTDITTGAVNGKVINNGGRIYSSIASTATSTHESFYNPNGLIASLQTNTINLDISIAQTDGAFRITSGVDRMFQVNDEGIITGTSTIPTDITTGAVNGKVINNGGRIYSSIASTATSTHESFYNPNGLIASLQTIANDFVIDAGTQGRLGVGGTQTYAWSSARFGPLVDNTITLGTSGGRWSVVYAGTGSINTSDEDEKTFHDLTPDQEYDKLLDAIDATPIRAYQFNDAIEAKGAENARMHFGIGAQTLKANLEAQGLDPFKYAVLCFDEWEEEVINKAVEATEAVEAKDAVLDADGNIIEEAIEAVEAVPAKEAVIKQAGSRYGIRYDEFYALKIACLERKLEA